MSHDAEHLATIRDAISALAGEDLAGTGRTLLGVMGYRSPKTLDAPAAPTQFLAALGMDSARFETSRWRAVHFLFQLAGDELPALSRGGDPTTGESFQRGAIDSFVFLAIDLDGGGWSRRQLVAIVRVLNRGFAMPAIVLFRHGRQATLTVIDRRANRCDASRDVVGGRISLVKDIDLARPHRAHVEILADLSLAALARRKAPSDFRALYDLWLETLSAAELNKRFYEELADWFAWASTSAGLLLPGDRKSVEPMAARVQPGRVQAAHQSLHHLVAKSEWPDDTVLAAVRARVLPLIERHGPIRALIIDDTGMPKKGKHSVGVARQYCGQLGKQDNCQVAVSLSAANDHASLPIAYRLYLPHEWADDSTRRARAGAPDDVVFQTKPQIALGQLRAALAAGIEAEVVLTRRPAEWCLIEWPTDEPEPTKYFLSTLPASISRRALVNTAKLRWRIERDYQDLKQELGFGHYKGRGWRGFHLHATLCIAAYGFLVSEREAIPSSGQRRASLIKEHPLPHGYRPRGSPDPT